MLTVNKLFRAGAGLAPALLRRAATVELDWDVRQRSRFDAVDSTGVALAVFLPRGTVVRGGDVLVAADGSLRVVRAAPQPLLVVRARARGGTPHDLLRAAYHLGNRHVQLEVRADALLLEPDHVLAALLSRRGLDVAETVEPFEPEAGAYVAGSASGDGHGHSHRHGHDHGHGHEHAHDDRPS